MSKQDPYEDKDTPYRDEQILRELYCERGLNVNEIADVLGCAPSTVNRWTNKYGLEHPSESESYREKDTLERLFYQEGLSRDDIAEKYGITRHAVNRWLREHDLQPETPSRRNGRLTVSGNGYAQFVDYTGADVDKRVSMHRLLAYRDHDLDELRGMDVHHKNNVPWDNRPENIEVADPEDHISQHSTERSDELSELWSEMWEQGVLDDRDSGG